MTFPVVKLRMCKEENYYPSDFSIIRKITKPKSAAWMCHWFCPNATGGEHVCRIMPIALCQIARSFYRALRRSLATARPADDFAGGIMLAQLRIGNPSLASLPLQFFD
ncbi:MAG TPA: hypothetical protein VF208_07685 [Candidatus Binatia bacterium]